MYCTVAGACCWPRSKEARGLQSVEVFYVRNWRHDADLFPHSNLKLDLFVHGHSVLLNL